MLTASVESRLMVERKKPRRDGLRCGAGAESLAVVADDEGAYELMLVEGRCPLAPLLEGGRRVEVVEADGAFDGPEAPLLSSLAPPPIPLKRLARLVLRLTPLLRVLPDLPTLLLSVLSPLVEAWLKVRARSLSRGRRLSFTAPPSKETT